MSRGWWMNSAVEDVRTINAFSTGSSYLHQRSVSQKGKLRPKSIHWIHPSSCYLCGRRADGSAQVRPALHLKNGARPCVFVLSPSADVRNYRHEPIASYYLLWSYFPVSRLHHIGLVATDAVKVFNHPLSEILTMVIRSLTLSISVFMSGVTAYTVFKKKVVMFVRNKAHLTREMKGFPNPLDLSETSTWYRACRQSRELGTSLNKPWKVWVGEPSVFHCQVEPIRLVMARQAWSL